MNFNCVNVGSIYNDKVSSFYYLLQVCFRARDTKSKELFSNVAKFFEILKNCKFWFFNYFKIKESSILVLWKKFKIKRTINSDYFKNLKE
jgi:hypothetical protein